MTNSRSKKETPLGAPADTGGATASTSIEAPVVDSIIGKIWANKYAKEFLLMLGATIGLQAATALIVLSGQLDSIQNLNQLYTTLEGWIGGAIGAIIITTFKQTLAYVIARLAGTKL